ncbi:hypothetical protein PR048_027780 [Dryococelus australis]|uniref:Uncharacterized protein n=1 Tax=Dryococelus australis TaxID=614101 RepID=A0ABQ9GHG8_9NEOP|nr:hypothetical protein PR048_027780 [Dryococelus australis]
MVCSRIFETMGVLQYFTVTKGWLPYTWCFPPVSRPRSAGRDKGDIATLIKGVQCSCRAACTFAAISDHVINEEHKHAAPANEGRVKKYYVHDKVLALSGVGKERRPKWWGQRDLEKTQSLAEGDAGVSVTNALRLPLRVKWGRRIINYFPTKDMLGRGAESGGVVVRPLGSHLGELGSIPGGIAPDDAVGRRVFLWASFVSLALTFGRCSILTSLHPHRLSRSRFYEPPRSLHFIQKN